MENKYISNSQLLFTECKIQFKCQLLNLEKITTKYKNTSPTFNIFSINNKENYILVTMKCSFVNYPTEEGFKVMEKELDILIAYLQSETIDVFQVNFSHKIDESYIDLTQDSNPIE